VSKEEVFPTGGLVGKSGIMIVFQGLTGLQETIKHSNCSWYFRGIEETSETQRPANLLEMVRGR
jgi:hypothetical protein